MPEQIKKSVNEMDLKSIPQGDFCPVCRRPSRVVYRIKSDVREKSSWENESTMILLGLDSVDSQLRLCSGCFHWFRFPLFEESRIYGDKGFQCRKETYERYFPGEKYGETEKVDQRGWLTKNKEAFAFLSGIFAHLARNPAVSKPLPTTVKILDWGGGDGYLAEATALISGKVLRVPCRSYCFDYHEWAQDSKSPYFQYLSMDDVKKQAPFDVIIVSHALEHTASPYQLLRQCRECLSSDGILMIAMPYELQHVLLRKTARMNYHQQLFSLSSLHEALRQAGFKDIHVQLSDLSYRGNKMWNILASARKSGQDRQARIWNALLDAISFLRVLFSLVIRRSVKALSAFANITTAFSRG